MSMIGEQRSQALWRVLAFIYAMTIASIIAGIVTIVGLVWGLIDVIWQALSNRNDLTSRSRPAKFVAATLQWNVNLLVFAFTGARGFMWLPDF